MVNVDVTILGDINIDIIVKFEGTLVDDISLITPNAKIVPGGVGANIASNLAHMGLKTRILGAVGNDVLGKYMLEKLEVRGIDTQFIQRIDEATTGFVIVLVNAKGEKMIIASRGANSYFKLEDKEIHHIVEETRHVHVSGYSVLNNDRGEIILRLLKYSKEKGRTTSLDLEGIAQYYPEFTEKLTGLLDIIFINRAEAKQLCKNIDPIECLINLAKTIKVKALFLKKGEEGSTILIPENKNSVKIIDIEPYKVQNIIDCTGAGDAYNAAVITSLLRGKSYIEAAREGNRAGALACTRLGGFI